MAQGRVPGLTIAILGLAVPAWVVTADRMAGMDSMPGMELGGLGFYMTMWVVMMAAMMFPAVAPMVLAYDDLRDRRAGVAGAPPDSTALFVGGYLLAWAVAGLLAYAAFELVRSLDPGFLAWGEAGRYVTAGVVVVAGAYQLTPAKRVCLDRCRSTRSFLTQRWRDGRTGALELGLRHGAWCIGSSWALFAALFAVGLMSLWWMVLMAAFIAAERLLPWPDAARVAVAVIVLAVGLGIAVAPSAVPGFSEPDGSRGGGDMQMAP